MLPSISVLTFTETVDAYLFSLIPILRLAIINIFDFCRWIYWWGDIIEQISMIHQLYRKKLSSLLHISELNTSADILYYSNVTLLSTDISNELSGLITSLNKCGRLSLKSSSKTALSFVSNFLQCFSSIVLFFGLTCRKMKWSLLSDPQRSGPNMIVYGV